MMSLWESSVFCFLWRPRRIIANIGAIATNFNLYRLLRIQVVVVAS